jgi:hypothetical protein
LGPKSKEYENLSILDLTPEAFPSATAISTRQVQ